MWNDNSKKTKKVAKFIAKALLVPQVIGGGTFIVGCPCFAIALLTRLFKLPFCCGNSVSSEDEALNAFKKLRDNGYKMTISAPLNEALINIKKDGGEGRAFLVTPDFKSVREVTIGDEIDLSRVEEKKDE